MNNDTCYICLEEINKDDFVPYCNCKGSHKYHKKCLEEYLSFNKHKLKCSICNYEFKYKSKQNTELILLFIKEFLKDFIDFIFNEKIIKIIIIYYSLYKFHEYLVYDYINDFSKLNYVFIINFIIYFEICIGISITFYFWAMYTILTSWFYSINFRVNKQELLEK